MQISGKIKGRSAGLLAAVLVVCTIVACGVDKSFYIGDKKIYYETPSGYTELHRDRCERYITRMGNAMANSGIILAAYFVSDGDYAIMTAPGMEDFEDLANMEGLVGDYIIVAYDESIALMDFPATKFQNIVEEIEGYDESTVGEINTFSEDMLKKMENVNEAGMHVTKPKLVAKTADRATFYQEVNTAIDGRQQETMFLMTLQFLEGKIGIVYHYYPKDKGLDVDSFYQQHRDVLSDIDLDT